MVGSRRVVVGVFISAVQRHQNHFFFFYINLYQFISNFFLVKNEEFRSNQALDDGYRARERSKRTSTVSRMLHVCIPSKLRLCLSLLSIFGWILFVFVQFLVVRVAVCLIHIMSILGGICVLGALKVCVSHEGRIWPTKNIVLVCLYTKQT